MSRKANNAARELIKSFEGLELSSYLCPAGVWTIGYGHTKGVKAGQAISIEQAETFLIGDMVDAEMAVERLVKVPLNDNQYAALVSFTFNLGEGNLQRSTLLAKLNAGDYAAVPAELAKWVHSGGKVLKGLKARREAEAELFQERA